MPNTTDNRLTKVLRFIYKNPYITYAELQLYFSKIPDIESLIHKLRDLDLIVFRNAGAIECDDGTETYFLEPHSHLVTSLDGNILIEQRSESDRKWRITTAIAIFAAIGAYRSELVLMLRAIVKLLE